ncbi:MAG: hypothetical protein ACI4RL_02255, partial [Ruminococcus sp.]
DDVMVNVKSAASTVSKKTNNIVDYSKLKFTASGLSNEIRKKYQTLGEEVYACSKIGVEDSRSIELLIQEIDELKAQLQTTNEYITAARHKVICPKCKAELDKDCLFCSQCGAKIEQDPFVPEEDTLEEEEEVVVEDPFKEVVVKSDSDEDAGMQE